VQRSIAIILTALFSWLIVLPMVLPSAAASLPACCRKNGKHRCVMTAGAESSASGPVLTGITAKCPCCPTATMGTQTQFSTPGLSAAIFAGLVRHPAVSPQVEASYRISHDRARQKRGPPSFILS
jgi:hypothetical protein